MSTIKSFFDKYLSFPDRKRKLSEERPHDYAPKRKLPRLSQLSVRRPGGPSNPEVPPLVQRHHPQLSWPQAQQTKTSLFGNFSFRNNFGPSTNRSSRFGMQTIDLESDDDVELVEYLARDQSPATFRVMTGRQNVPRPLPALIPRHQAGNAINGTGNVSSQRSELFPSSYPGGGYAQFKKSFKLANNNSRSNSPVSRSQMMVNSALRKTFELEERQKYSDMCSGIGSFSTSSRAPIASTSSLFGALKHQEQQQRQRPTSIFSCLPFAAPPSINIGSRNKYSKLLEKFSSDFDTRHTTTRTSNLQPPTMCVDLTRNNGPSNGGIQRRRRQPQKQRPRHSSGRAVESVELTDDEDEELSDDVDTTIHLDDDGNSFKIPKSFPCAPVDSSPYAATAAASSWRNNPINKFKSPTLLAKHQDDDEDEATTIVLEDDDQATNSSTTRSQSGRRAEKVDPVNSLLDEWQTKPVFKDDWLAETRRRYSSSQEKMSARIAEELQRQEDMDREGRQGVQEMIRKMDEALLLREVIVVEDEEAVEAAAAAAAQQEKVTPLPSFNNEQVNLIRYAAGRGSPDEVLVTKFNLSITRRDIATLLGDAWLNDEVINFYMNLLMERSTSGAGEKKYPKVYAMNTFFMPKVLQQGQSGVRRWTRKTDIFSYDVIPVPVHVSNIHWCMAIIHLKEKTIRYYDSMGQPNRRVLDALEQYLKDESMDKRQVAFSTDGWVKESVADCPRQMNGSDCGVFSCMFAEYVTRDHRINFSQDNMPYFRQKMILEICSGKLLL